MTNIEIGNNKFSSAELVLVIYLNLECLNIFVSKYDHNLII